MPGSAREKTYKLLANRGFTLLIRENSYETAVIYMNPWCQSAERNRNGQNRQKKGSKPKLFLLVHLGTIPQHFTKKKNSHFTIPFRLQDFNSRFS